MIKNKLVSKAKKKTDENALYRINAIDIAPRALLLAVSVLLSVLLVSLMISQFRSAQDMANISSDIISEKTETMRNGDILKYDGLEISGGDVVNFCLDILKNAYSGIKSDIKIILKGSSGENRTYDTYESILGLKDPEAAEYVNPVTRWYCRVNRNKNGIITDVVFSKK